MKKLYRLLSGLLALTAVLVLTACGGPARPDNSQMPDSSDPKTGGYVEEDISPDQNEGLGMFWVNDTLHYFSIEYSSQEKEIAISSQTVHWYEMQPDGSWNERTDHGFEQITAQIDETASSWPWVYLDQDGTLYWNIQTQKQEGDTVYEKNIPFVVRDGKPQMLEEIPAGKIAVFLDPTSLQTAICGDTVIRIANSGEAEVFDLQGNPINCELPNLEQKILLCGNENGFYTQDWDSSKVRHYLLGGTTAETVLDGSWYSLSDPGIFVKLAAVDPDENLYLSVSDGAGSNKLLRYRWDPDAATQSNGELTVFSLYHSAFIDTAANEMKKTHGINVVYSYALEEESGSGGAPMQIVGSRSDALTQLNTQLLSGSGPDVIVLDDMPIDSIIEKGVLTDLSGVVSGEQLYSNLANAFRTEAGVFALPMRGFPLLLGSDPATLDSIPNAESLTEQLAHGPQLFDNTKNSQPKRPEELPLLGFDNTLWLFHGFYPLYESSIWQDGKLNETAYRNFAEMLGEIVSGSGKELRKGGLDSLWSGYYQLGNGTNGKYINYGCRAFCEPMNSVMDTADAFHFYSERSGLANEGAVKALTTADGHSSLRPSCITGINANAENPEAAMQFVQLLSSKEVQKSCYREGFPANKIAAEEIWKDGLKQCGTRCSSDLNQIIENMEVSHHSSVLQSAAAKGMEEYFKTGNLDSAVKIAQDSAKLWLAEQ